LVDLQTAWIANMQPVTYSWLVVVVAIACAAIGWLGIAGWIAVAVVIASVGMHVAGKAADRDLSRLRHRTAAPAEVPRPKPTRLERRQSLGRLVPVSAGIGATVGGATGAAALATLTSASIAGAALGGVSSAVIGGLFGFLAASFVEIIRTSLREAIAAERSSVTVDR
jgi:hypothetical protein